MSMIVIPDDENNSNKVVFSVSPTTFGEFISAL